MPEKIARTIPRSRLLKDEPLPKLLTVEVHALLKKYRPKHPALVWYDKAVVENEKRNAAFSKAHSIAIKESGVIEAEEEYMALWDVAMKLCDKIIKTPAHSILGLQLKVNAIKLVGDDREEHGGPLERAWLVAQHDINRLSV